MYIEDSEWEKIKKVLEMVEEMWLLYSLNSHGKVKEDYKKAALNICKLISKNKKKENLDKIKLKRD